MLLHAKTFLTTNLMESSENIWEKSAKFAATKQNELKSGLTNNSLSRFNNPPKEEHVSCILNDNIPNYLNGGEN